jgi:periplasmic protein TonB
VTRRAALILLFVCSVAAQPYAPQPQQTAFCGGITNPPCTTPPRPTHSPGPNYPKKQGNARLPGTVVLEVVVGPDGLPRDITVFRSLNADFDKEAIESVKEWQFRPATLDGKPVATKIHVEVTFNAFH